MKRFFSSILVIFAVCVAAQASQYKLSSPSGNLVICVEDGDALRWSLSRGSESILNPSAIALHIDGVKDAKVKVRGVSRRSVDQTLTAVVPVKHRNIRDRFSEMTLRLGGGVAVEFRAYDNGAAYRFVTSKKGTIDILDETCELDFAGDFEAFWACEKNPEFITHCEADFRPMQLSTIVKPEYSYLPVSISTPSATRLVFSESDLSDYPNLFLEGGNGTTLKAIFPKAILSYEMKNDRDVAIRENAPYIARTSGSRSFPWRVLTVGDDRELLENTLVWQLASKEQDADYSWIRPGKISWEWWAMLNVYGVDFKAGVNNETYKYYIDFASKYGLEYILLDEGWSASTLNIVECKPDLDVRGLVEYGRQKGVGVVLWTLWTPMKDDMEHILDVYRDWGVAGIKIDFMQLQDQGMVNFYEKVAAECMKRHLLVDYHGAFKPAGLQRKYPNAMTFEGVYGMEHDKCSYDISPEHDMQLPFTRMVAGPMDYTPGATINATKEDFSIRWNHPMSQGTRSHQAAIFVAFESPLMMLCDSPSNYYRNPEFTSFLAQVPTVWEETRSLEAAAGDYLLMARRAADGRWFAAGLTDWEERALVLDTSFLGDGEWEVLIHRDGVNANMWAEDYKIETLNIKAGDELPVWMAQGGGWAAIFTRK